MKKNYQKPTMKTGKINDQLLAGSASGDVITNIDGGDTGITGGGGGSGQGR